MMFDRRSFAIGLAASVVIPRAAGAAAGDPIVFAYFGTGKGEAAGLKLALSEDGYVFREVAGGASFLVPAVGEARLMRDPFLFRGMGDDRRWHMLWTTAWESVTIGHAASEDLRHWTVQTALPVMRDVAGTRNCWAPEAVWDPARRHWVIFWSSTVAGRYRETAGQSEAGYNHRLWRTTTADFRALTPAELLYDPGFSVIDGTFATGRDGRLRLIVKDETRFPPKKHLRVAEAASPTGPFGPLSPPFSPDWVEGPMTLRIGADTICYYDIYRDGRWGAARTRDFRTWEDVSARLSMPNGARHGSLVRVPRRIADALARGPA